MPKSKFKIAIASGKGGVGKSMLTSALAMLFNQVGKKVIAVDCDVDAPNLAVWLNEIDKWDKIKEVSVSQKPVIDFKKCTGCGLCVENCQFRALSLNNNKPVLNNFLCEGCGACQIVCPQKAISLKKVISGQIKTKETKYGFPLVVGQLYPGETGSGKVVLDLKKQADEFKHNLMVIDSAPGTGCPVNAALQDANFVVLVTEPTPSGLADLKRVLEVVNHFHIPSALVINKWDINPKFTQDIVRRSKDSGRQALACQLLGKISYDQKIFKAVSRLQPIMETNLKVKKEIEKIFYELLIFLR